MQPNEILQNDEEFLRHRYDDELKNKVIQGDCLEIMQQIPPKSIDMILCDLP